VFSTVTGDVAYQFGDETTTPPMYAPHAAAADEGRSLFYVVSPGPDTLGGPVSRLLLAAVRAADGQIVRSRVLADASGADFALAYDEVSDVIVALIAIRKTPRLRQSHRARLTR
jgi:hypothetical protein